MLCIPSLPPSMRIEQIISGSFLPSRSYHNMRNFVLDCEKTEATGICWKEDGVELGTGKNPSGELCVHGLELCIQFKLM